MKLEVLEFKRRSVASKYITRIWVVIFALQIRFVDVVKNSTSTKIMILLHIKDIFSHASYRGENWFWESSLALSRFLFTDVVQEYDDFWASSLSCCQRPFRYDSRPVLSNQVGRIDPSKKASTRVVLRASSESRWSVIEILYDWKNFWTDDDESWYIYNWAMVIVISTELDIVKIYHENDKKNKMRGRKSRCVFELLITESWMNKLVKNKNSDKSNTLIRSVLDGYLLHTDS